MKLIQYGVDHEINLVVLSAWRSAREYTDGVADINDMYSCLNEELFESVRDEVETFFNDFGIVIEVNSFDEISHEMLIDSGVNMPRVSMSIARQVFIEQKLCFIDNGLFINSPQTSLFGGKYEQTTRRASNN